MSSFLINTNINSLGVQANLMKNNRNLDVALERLSSGLRINSAKDDIAGLAISDRLSAQILSTRASIKNAMDGISVAQTAEGAIANITDSLLRVRELAARANNSALSTKDVNAIQQEISQQLAAIDKVISETRFGQQKIFQSVGQVGFGGDQGATVDGLKGAWLTESEKMIEKYYGLKGDGADLEVKFYSDGSDSRLAFVTGYSQSNGMFNKQSMSINLAAFTNNPPNGGSAPYYGDRIIAHEMVHAVMERTMNFATVPTWFAEGAAEFIHGADERVAGVLSTYSGTAAQKADTLVAKINLGSWGNTTDEYAAGYVAVRYLHNEIKANGGNGIIDLMNYMKGDISRTFDNALSYLATQGLIANNQNSDSAFKTEFAKNTAASGVGTAFVQGMNLNNTDTGAIGGLDADGQSIKDANSVVANVAEYSDKPLEGFHIIWPDGTDSLTGGDNNFRLQVGIIKGEYLDMDIKAVNVTGMGLDVNDIINNPDRFLVKVDHALTQIDGARATLGATQNRLTSTINNLTNVVNNIESSRSRISDADFAIETASLTKFQILQSSGISVLAQANSSRQMVLNLLK